MVKYVFVGGLHRSGTSLVARMIGEIKGVASIRSSPAPENEGVYLQGAIPHTALHGRPMHFATDPLQHLVEECRFDNLETRTRLGNDWDPWFSPADASWRVEKSPVNLTRMRLYQQLFPLSQFVVIIRHPQAVHAAVSKWVDISRKDAMAHWIEAHNRVARDLPHLHSVMLARYEDIADRPLAYRKAFAAFLGLRNSGAPGEEIRNGNNEYSGWAFDNEEAQAAREWAYADHLGAGKFTPVIQHPLREVRGAVQTALRADP